MTPSPSPTPSPSVTLDSASITNSFSECNPESITNSFSKCYFRFAAPSPTPSPSVIPSPTPTPSATLTPVSEEPFDFTQLSDGYEQLPSSARQSVVFTGTIVEVNLEGGFKGIELDSGVKYVPLNIQEEIMGLYVGTQISVSSAYIYPDHAGIQMWGTYLYVVEYEFVTPSEICFEDFGTMELAVTDADDQSTYLNGISVTSSISGKLRFKATQGPGEALPSVYLCALEDQSVQFKITSTAISFDTTFMFESTNGSVYRGNLDTTTLQGGVNNFVEHDCGKLFSVNSVELKDIWTKSQPIYEALVSDGEYLSGIQFNDFKVNSNSPLYSDVFPDFTTQGGYGYGYGGGYSSLVYGIAIHKSDAEILGLFIDYVYRICIFKCR